MKNILKRIAVIIVVVYICTFCGCVSPFTRCIAEEEGTWVSEKITFASGEEWFGVMLIDGIEIEIFVNPGAPTNGQSMYIYHKEYAESDDINRYDKFVIWHITYKWKGDDIIVKVVRDFAYERGESTVNHKGDRYYLTKQNDVIS